MNTDADFYGAFAGRVRQQLATTRSTAPEGDTMSTDISETTKTALPVPATFRSANPHDAHAWCTETDPAADCHGPEIALPTEDGTEVGILAGQLAYDAEDDETVLLYQRYADWNRVTPAELRGETARVRTHLARLDALADQYDAIREVSTSDGTQVAEPASLPRREWVISDRRSGVTVRGYLPPWAEEDPSGVHDEPRPMTFAVEDVFHHRRYPALRVSLYSYVRDEKRFRNMTADLLVPEIACDPSSDKPDERIPHANVELEDGLGPTISRLDPAGVRALAEQLRKQAALLDQVAVDLAAARQDWAKNGGTA